MHSAAGIVQHGHHCLHQWRVEYEVDEENPMVRYMLDGFSSDPAPSRTRALSAVAARKPSAGSCRLLWFYESCSLARTKTSSVCVIVGAVGRASSGVPTDRHTYPTSAFGAFAQPAKGANSGHERIMSFISLHAAEPLLRPHSINDGRPDDVSVRAAFGAAGGRCE